MPGEKDQLSQLAYQTFCDACGSRQLLPWEELPPLIQDAWKVVVSKILVEGVAGMVVNRALHSGDPKETEESNVNT